MHCENPPFISPPNEIIYDIKTSKILFNSYLENAEPIEIKLISLKTKTQIGTVFVKIPQNFLGTSTKPLSCCISTFKIFSNRNQTVGDIKIGFKMIFDPKREKFENKKIHDSIKATENDEKVSIDRENFVPKSRSTIIKKSKVDFDFDQKILKSTQSIPSNRSFQELKFSDRSIILNYLTGETMTKREESLALNELYSVSPPESIIEAITTPLFENNHQNYDKYGKGKLLIGYKRIILTDIGYHYLKKYNSGNCSFTFYITDHKTNKQVESQPTDRLNDIHFSNTSNVFFGKSDKYLFLTIKYVTTYRAFKNIFGHSKIILQEMVDSKILAQKFAIHNDENDIIVGHIIINFENLESISKLETKLKPIMCNHDDQNDNVHSNKQLKEGNDGEIKNVNNFDKSNVHENILDTNVEGMKIALNEQHQERNYVSFF